VGKADAPLFPFLRGASHARRALRGFRNTSAFRLMTAPGAMREDRTMSSERHALDLADRHTHDLDVVLMWSRVCGRVWVTVTHRRSGRTARIDASPRNALDVFEHPFAYERAAA